MYLHMNIAELQRLGQLGDEAALLELGKRVVNVDFAAYDMTENGSRYMHIELSDEQAQQTLLEVNNYVYP